MNPDKTKLLLTTCYFKTLLTTEGNKIEKIDVICYRNLVWPDDYLFCNMWKTSHVRLCTLRKVKMLVVQHITTQSMGIKKMLKSNNHSTKCTSELKPQRFQLNWRKYLKCVDKQVCEAIKRLGINYREEMCNLMCLNHSNAHSCLPNIVWNWWKRSECKFWINFILWHAACRLRFLNRLKDVCHFVSRDALIIFC